MLMKFRSGPFRQGFADGFSSPFSLFGGARSIEFVEKYAVEESWRDRKSVV